MAEEKVLIDSDKVSGLKVPCGDKRDKGDHTLSKAEKRKRRRATPKYRCLHATRERIRVESFNSAFSELRSFLPTSPKDKKLSKIEILRLSIAYIKYLDYLLTL